MKKCLAIAMCYVKAGIMARENDWPGARWELEIAKQLQPDFASASAVFGLQAKIESGERELPAPRDSTRLGIPVPTAIF